MEISKEAHNHILKTIKKVEDNSGKPVTEIKRNYLKLMNILSEKSCVEFYN